ncbi:uncharacterized protein Pyn_20991 [Prunus yedoensis var. nudiflora]|uniref:DUF7870 domain-containing protein n=1 Tax=Prunus yedoensis var. nudiflora TaxID=2094558 RepID=A0A314ZR06_PRUYE|nr:uncharacterized protein Pyn_20991 [Prunus yedoensis var. nudiflora]
MSTWPREVQLSESLPESLWGSFNSTGARRCELDVSVVRELMSQQLLNYGTKALCVGEGSAQPCVALQDLGFPNARGVYERRFFSLKRKQFVDLDKVSVPALLVLEIERVLSPGGIGAILVGSSISAPNSLIRSATPISSLLKSSSVVHVNHIEALGYVDIGAAEHLNSNATNWFLPSYPVERKAFHTYFVDHNTSVLLSYVKKPGITFVYHPGLAGIKAQVNVTTDGETEPYVGDEGFDFHAWFKETVQFADFVVLKMNAGNVELKFLTELFESGAICFVDELFLHCSGVC